MLKRFNDLATPLFVALMIGVVADLGVWGIAAGFAIALMMSVDPAAAEDPNPDEHW